MPPKVKISKDAIVDAAVDIVRKSSAQALNARTVAAALNCSTQPIFSNFATMDALHLSVVQKVAALCREYRAREVAREEFPPYKASGIAYIRFAKEEPELFKLLYMRNRAGSTTATEEALFSDMEALVHKNTGLAAAASTRFHLEMWAFVHGIAVMLATGYLDLDWSVISQMLTDTYLGLRKQHERV